MSVIRDIANEARAFAAEAAKAHPTLDVKTLFELIFRLEDAGTRLAPIKVKATFTRTFSSREDIVEERDVTLYLTVYETQAGDAWLSLHMAGGPTGFESLVLLAGSVAVARGRAWLACSGTRDSWARCEVSGAEMDRALKHWGRA